MKGDFVAAFVSMDTKVDDYIADTLKSMIAEKFKKSGSIVEDLDKQLEFYYDKLSKGINLSVFSDLVHLLFGINDETIIVDQIKGTNNRGIAYYTFVGTPSDNMNKDKLDGYIKDLKQKILAL
jgi:hypothetical protein